MLHVLDSDCRRKEKGKKKENKLKKNWSKTITSNVATVRPALAGKGTLIYTKIKIKKSKQTLIAVHVDDEKRRMWTFMQPKWFEAAQEEYWACKERVCIMDMSSFAKFELEVGVCSSWLHAHTGGYRQSVTVIWSLLKTPIDDAVQSYVFRRMGDPYVVTPMTAIQCSSKWTWPPLPSLSWR